MNDASPAPEGDGLFEKYMLQHPADVRGCLRQLIDKRATLLMFTPGSEQAVSMALAINDSTLWVDVPRNEALTERLLRAERVRFESAIDRITVRFSAGPALRTTFEGAPALQVPVPGKVMHLQRREYVRREPIGSLTCTLPMHTTDGGRKVMRAHIADIGGGGLAVLTAEDTGLTLAAGDVIPEVSMSIPDQGDLTVALRVQHAARIDQNGRKVWRAGCSFVDLDVHDQARLLRYVMHLDRAHSVRVRDAD